MTINPEELAICKRRGHDPLGDREKWKRCKYCGMWTRTVSVREEREDEPPEDEQDGIWRLERRFAEEEQE
jgi:hypothetical protein